MTAQVPPPSPGRARGTARGVPVEPAAGPAAGGAVATGAAVGGGGHLGEGLGEPGQATRQSDQIAVRDGALQLLAGVPRPPTALRLSAFGVHLELEWTPPAAAGAVVPAAALAVDDAAPAGSAMPGTAPAGSAASGTTLPGTARAGDPATASPDTVESPVAALGAGHQQVRSPSVGVFYRAPEPGAKAFVEIGDFVVTGQQIAIIEVMKLMLPVTAETDGQVEQILRENNTPVEYGEPLFVIAVQA
ncbi:MAG TPA: biotin/lipoyl-containing protein [Kineosporiaceae bacterium]